METLSSSVIKLRNLLKSNKIKIVHFTKKDVERSQIVKEILDIYGE